MTRYRIIAESTFQARLGNLSDMQRLLGAARLNLSTLGGAGTVNAARLDLASLAGCLDAFAQMLREDMEKAAHATCPDCGSRLREMVRAQRWDARTHRDEETAVCLTCEAAAQAEATKVRAEDHSDARRDGH